MAIETIDVADALACAIDNSYDEEQNVFLSAHAASTPSGRVWLTVVVEEPAVELAAESTYHTFRFEGEKMFHP